MPRETPQLYMEYVAKSAYWPRWSQPYSRQQSTQAQPQPAPQPTAPLAASSQQPVSIVVVHNSTNQPIPMQTLLQMYSRYALPRQPSAQPTQAPFQTASQSPSQTPLQTPSTQTSQQLTVSTPQPQQQTVFIVINTAGGNVPNTDDILNRLFTAQQPQTVPTSQAFVNSLPKTSVSSDGMAKQPQCTVCMEEFKENECATQLPCKHLFHEDCIKPWLRTQHTCPMCRHELPVDTPTQNPTYPALPAPTEPIITASPALPTTSPTPALAALSSTPSTSQAVPTSTQEPSPQPTAGIKRGGLEEEEHVSKKSKVEESQTEDKQTETTEQELKKGLLSEEPATKKKKVEETKETNTEIRPAAPRRQRGNDFGFKRGFLL